MCMHSEGKEEERKRGRRVKIDCVCLKRGEREHEGQREPELESGWRGKKSSKGRDGGNVATVMAQIVPMRALFVQACVGSENDKDRTRG